MDVTTFVSKWAQNQQKETANYTEHFLDVCQLVGARTPNDDPTGADMAFQAGMKKRDGSQGFADVWYRGRFAMEYKGKGKYVSLAEAYEQLLRYREGLDNPPLLVVCDIDRWEIHTNFTGSRSHVTSFTNQDLLRPDIRQHLYNLFFNPNAFRQYERQALTKAAGVAFAGIVSSMERENETPEHIANFLTRILFCLFADSIGMLPPVLVSLRPTDVQILVNGEQRGGIFRHLLDATDDNPNEFRRLVKELFDAMANGKPIFTFRVAYFDGTLFEDVYDPGDALLRPAVRSLAEVADLEWRAIDPSIFGAVFERTLNAEKRAQLGAHYTSEDDIRLVVGPVLMAPFEREWEALKPQATDLRARYDAATSGKVRADHHAELLALRDGFLTKLRSVKVLDPACGSGNFLYVALRMLLDLEYAVLQFPAFHGLEDTTTIPQVHPRQLYGIEIDPIAHALASIVVWIGYWQWRIEHAYYPPPPGSRYETVKPYLEPMRDNILCQDAILAYDPDGNPIEPAWPAVDVIVGNPPFLGSSRLLSELGEDYATKIRALYRGNVSGDSDLVTYWFEKARRQLEAGNVTRVGLLSTNSIRGGANREVLHGIKNTGDIFLAYSDQEWTLDGAAVRVSMVGFDNGTEPDKFLDGIQVNAINPDLTAGVDLTTAIQLVENSQVCYRSDEKGGPFDISKETAEKMLISQNLSGLSNADVIFEYRNGWDVTRRNRKVYVIDFGVEPSINDAMQYEEPFKHVETHVKPMRANNRVQRLREKWWIHRIPGTEFRRAISSLSRFIVTPSVAKHRVFVWLKNDVLPDHQLYVFAREDDYFFGVLHSRLHEVWSLRMGTSLEDRPRYTPTTTFETFPFPWPPGQEPADDPRLLAIAAAAKQLHEERAAWLDPDGMSETAKAKRTLTNLYNALNVWRGLEAIRTVPEAADFAPRLDELHQALDRAVCDAYGWPRDILADEEALLRQLLALNLERAAASGAAVGAVDDDEDGDDE